jgi:hypothetical protein
MTTLQNSPPILKLSIPIFSGAQLFIPANRTIAHRQTRSSPVDTANGKVIRSMIVLSNGERTLKLTKRRK